MFPFIRFYDIFESFMIFHFKPSLHLGDEKMILHTNTQQIGEKKIPLYKYPSNPI